MKTNPSSSAAKPPAKLPRRAALRWSTLENQALFATLGVIPGLGEVTLEIWQAECAQDQYVITVPLRGDRKRAPKIQALTEFGLEIWSDLPDPIFSSERNGICFVSEKNAKLTAAAFAFALRCGLSASSAPLNKPD